MQDLLRPIYQERASNPNTLGIVSVEKMGQIGATTDTFDVVLLVIMKENDDPIHIKHYNLSGEMKAALHLVTEEQLREWMLLGSNRKIIEWLLQGKILFDRNDYLYELRNEMENYPVEFRSVKMGVEFAKLIRRFVDGKSFIETGYYLDAYNHITHALHHLARLTIIEKGFHPEVTLWGQVRNIEPEIYKLYDELLVSEETLAKRLELLILAIDFLISRHAEKGSDHLTTVLARREEPWTVSELIQHPEFKTYGVDFVVLLEYVVQKGIVRTELMETKGIGVFHRVYYV